MKKWSRIFITLLFASVFFTSCSDDDSVDLTPALGAYEKGTFVLNEGSATKGTITFISNSGAVEQDVFTKVNPSSPVLGGYLQSLFFDETRAFVVSGSGIITVVDRFSFQYIATITSNIKNPRYGVVINGKAYVTNSASSFNSGYDDFLTIIDLSNYATSKVNLNNWAEKLIAINDKLYISNGFDGSGNSITPFNIQTNTSQTPITLGFSPNSIDEENNVLYVLGSNNLAKINTATNTIMGEVQTLPAQTDAKNLVIENETLFYTSENGIYKTGLTSTSFPTSPIFTYSSNSPSVLYGFAVNDDQIFIADAGDFASNTRIYQYSIDGLLQNTVSVGVAPNGFYFN